ncbi:SDR family oxidoreductase [Actinophytocola sp.]|uniref:SDR family oxidoreductase n=1 Tax=Actinophytocola sp. TaxID=1872138 RepID=UPI003D6AB378
MAATTPAQPLVARTVLVTGGSSGIGQATARLFAERGARVFATSRGQHPDEGGVEMLRLDVRSAESVRRCVDEVLARAGQLDVLVNNAGVMQEGFVEETSDADAAAVMDANFFGTVRVTHAVLPGMRERRRGRIINVGSLAAWVGEPGEGFYAASKAALARYTEALRHEVWHLGIAVSLVEPGAFATGVLRAGSVTEATISDYDGPRESAHRTLRDALRRGADPRKAAAVIGKVASVSAPRARYGAGWDGVWVPYLKAVLPQRVVDLALRRGYHLPMRRPR